MQFKRQLELIGLNAKSTFLVRPASGAWFGESRGYMTTSLQEGAWVRHMAQKFVGLHGGFTRLTHLMERPGDLRGVRVVLPDGAIRIASEYNLETVELAEYEQYAVKIGVQLKGRRTSSVAPR
jgi:hypothetical protein